ncbi:MAG: radical SAM domain-containing protein [Solirubrobacteraceae bacterium]
MSPPIGCQWTPSAVTVSSGAITASPNSTGRARRRTRTAVGVAPADRYVIVCGDALHLRLPEQRPDRIALRAEAAKVAETEAAFTPALAGIGEHRSRGEWIRAHAAEHGDPRHGRFALIGPKGRYVTRLVKLVARLRALAAATRSVAPETEAALARRWRELPAHVRTPAQLLGTRTAGCEGTHGVFPRCDLTCTPCYHARSANRVRTDGQHTLEQIDRQMAYLRKTRGTGQHAQLIGGEVTLLGPEDHAAALELMHRHGRKPMSMTHGDFDYEYLKRLAVGRDGRRRVDMLRFAGHFDSLMLGRRGIPRPASEAELHPYRRRFVAQFERLRREHGVRYDLAHNMTVTPRNLDQVAEVVRECRGMGFGMLSFQPAAYVGNPRRWREDFHAVSIDSVWREIERGAGTRLPWSHLQMGDERCNRSAYGVLVGDRWTALLDDREPRDLRVRDAFLSAFGGMDFDRPRWALAIATARVLAGDPRLIGVGTGWARRFVRRVGPLALLRGHPRGLTFVVHAFMDAEVVRPAWEALQRDETAADPAVRAAQERLRACSYAMAHPDQDRLVPACVQHAVLDPQENTRLAALLPLPEPQR